MKKQDIRNLCKGKQVYVVTKGDVCVYISVEELIRASAGPHVDVELQIISFDLVKAELRYNKYGTQD